MPIPPLNEHGLLPSGIHLCSLEEIEVRFGRFQTSDRRPRLFVALREFIREVKSAGIGLALLINGSFVTAKSSPEDIDVILLVGEAHDFQSDLSPAEYNIFSAHRVRRRHQLDLLVARLGSDQLQRYLTLFQQVRLEPDKTKGILRVNL
jgi:hypothetical protein